MQLELKGKVLGFSGLRVGEYWLTREVLKVKGLGPKDVDAIQVGTSPAKFAALEKGSIAATLLFQPTAAQAVASGFTSLYDFSETSGFIPLLYMVNRKWAADKDYGKRLSRAIRTAHESIRQTGPRRSPSWPKRPSASRSCSSRSTSSILRTRPIRRMARWMKNRSRTGKS